MVRNSFSAGPRVCSVPSALKIAKQICNAEDAEIFAENRETRSIIKLTYYQKRAQLDIFAGYPLELEVRGEVRERLNRAVSKIVEP